MRPGQPAYRAALWGVWVLTQGCVWMLGKLMGGGAETEGCPLNTCSLPFLTTRPRPTEPPSQPRMPPPGLASCVAVVTSGASRTPNKRVTQLPLPFSPPGRQTLDVEQPSAGARRCRLTRWPGGGWAQMAFWNFPRSPGLPTSRCQPLLKRTVL